jgi:hypothetical protein
MGFSNDNPFVEKRESPRINWVNSEVQASITSSHTKAKLLGWILDISQGGFKLKAEIEFTAQVPFREWDEVYFETFEDFFELKGQGRVMWASSDKKVVGVRIDSLDEESRRYLYGFLGILPLS